MNCERCGAPAPQGVVMCPFCAQPVSAELARTAIPCPNAQCRTPNVWGAMKCLRCASWLVVQCVFCGGMSPYNQSACLSCREAFAGAPQRKAARDGEIARQRNLQTFGTVGGVVAPFAGALAGGMIGGYVGSGFGYHHNYGYGGYGGYDGGSYGGYDGGSGGGDGGGSWAGGGTSGVEVGGSDGGDFGGISDAGSSFDGGSDFGGGDFGGGDFGGFDT